MDSEFRKCQKWVSSYYGISAAESAKYIKDHHHIVEDDPTYQLGLTFTSFLKSHLEFERKHCDVIHDITAYRDYIDTGEEEKAEGVVHPRLCDTAEFKSAIPESFLRDFNYLCSCGCGHKK